MNYKQRAEELRKELLDVVNKEFDKRTSYQIQKGGISSNTYAQIRLRPEKTRIDTLLKILDKLDKMPKRKVS